MSDEQHRLLESLGWSRPLDCWLWTNSKSGKTANNEEVLASLCDAMAEELKALRTQGKAVCEALDRSIEFVDMLIADRPHGDTSALKKIREVFQEPLTSARVVFPK